MPAASTKHDSESIAERRTNDQASADEQRHKENQREGASLKTGGSIRAVAAFEAVKGLLAVVAGGGLLLFGHMHQHPTAAIVHHFHLNPASKHPSTFEQLLLHVTDARLHIIAVVALAYAAIRFAEAWGLWRGRSWAGWLAVVSGAIYLPFEVVEFARTHDWIAGILLAVNALVVVLVWSRLQSTETRNAGATQR